MSEYKNPHAEGFDHDFRVNHLNQLECTTHPKKPTYELGEFGMELFLRTTPFTIYHITTHDGLRGTLYDYWEVV